MRLLMTAAVQTTAGQGAALAKPCAQPWGSRFTLPFDWQRSSYGARVLLLAAGTPSKGEPVAESALTLVCSGGCSVTAGVWESYSPST